MRPPYPTQRLLDACPGCARQYDVTSLAAGEEVRCACGQVFPARRIAPRSPRVLSCSSCGANLREHARQCDFCRAEITLEERLLGSVCPRCFARARIDARHCMECGTAIEPQALAAVPEGGSCPRCTGELRSRDVGGAGAIECAGCGGMWLEPRVFEALCLRAERELPPMLASQPPPVRPAGDEARYLPCLRCGDMMVRRSYAGRSGVVIDLCREHGVWLDHGEVERVVDWIRAGGRADSPWTETASRREPRSSPPIDPFRSPARSRRLRRTPLEVVVDAFGSLLERWR